MSSLRPLNQRSETGGVINSNIGKNFSVEIDPRALQSTNEFAVGNLVASASSIDAHNPERTEVSLLEPSSYIAVAKRLLDRFLRGSIQLRLSKKETFCATKGLVAIVSPVSSSFNSWHVFSLLFS
jgi:hypothetical protein